MDQSITVWTCPTMNTAQHLDFRYGSHETDVNRALKILQLLVSKTYKEYVGIAGTSFLNEKIIFKLGSRLAQSCGSGCASLSSPTSLRPP